MLWGGADGTALELRASPNGARRISGRFPYNSKAVLSDGGKAGRPLKERFAPGAFTYSLKAPADIHLLVGHSFDRPLASKNAGTLAFDDTPEALTFEAEVVPEVARTSYATDLFSLILSGLVVGLSPGFRIPPPAAVPPDQAEKVEEEPPDEGRALIRTILQAILFELSIVTRPAYPDAQVEARNWTPSAGGVLLPDRKPVHAASRWR
jgi:HK97 family phage prohead protease